MTLKRLLAILFIFASTAIAWFALGGSVVARTGRSDHAMTQAVKTLWGGEHRQTAPRAFFCRERTVVETVTERDATGEEVKRQVEKVVKDEIPIALASSRVTVDLDLEHRRKGLLWHDTYAVAFEAIYTVEAPPDLEGPVWVAFAFPSSRTIYDDFSFRVDGREAPPATQFDQGLRNHVALEPGATEVLLADLRPGPERREPLPGPEYRG